MQGGRNLSRKIARGRKIIVRRLAVVFRGLPETASPAVEKFLLSPPGGRSVVPDATFVAELPCMVFPTAKRTAQIPTTCVSGMSEKPNPAVIAVSDATLQLRMGLQDRVQRDLILPDKRPGAIVLVPIRPK